MRVMLILLVFAIGFSGFTVAAHAFDSTQCHEAASVTLTDKAPSHDCPEHTGKQSQSAEQSSKKDTCLCLSCDHCGVSHVGFAQFGYTFYTPDRTDAYVVADTSMADNGVSGLKRPPKYLV